MNASTCIHMHMLHQFLVCSNFCTIPLIMLMHRMLRNIINPKKDSWGMHCPRHGVVAFCRYLLQGCYSCSAKGINKNDA